MKSYDGEARDYCSTTLHIKDSLFVHTKLYALLDVLLLPIKNPLNNINIYIFILVSCTTLLILCLPMTE